MPMRTRTKSGVPSRWMMLRRPLWPAWPPPIFKRTSPNGEIELVVHDDDVRGIDFDERRRGLHANRPTRS